MLGCKLPLQKKEYSRKINTKTSSFFFRWVCAKRKRCPPSPAHTKVKWVLAHLWVTSVLKFPSSQLSCPHDWKVVCLDFHFWLVSWNKLQTLLQNRCGLWTIVAQSYEYDSLKLLAFRGPYRTYMHHAHCVQPRPLESTMGGLALNLIELQQSCSIAVLF